MTNMLEIIYYSKNTWLGIQVVFDTCSRFTFIFCRKFLKKHRVLNIQDGCFQFSILKKDKKFVGFFHDQKQNQLLHPPTSQPGFPYLHVARPAKLMFWRFHHFQLCVLFGNNIRHFQEK